MESECYPAISMSTATSGGGGGGEELLTREDVSHRTASSSSDATDDSDISSNGSGVSQPGLTSAGAVTNVSIGSITSVSNISNVTSVSNTSGVSCVSAVSAVPSAQRPASGSQLAAPRRLVLTQQSREELQLLRADRTVQPAHIKVRASYQSKFPIQLTFLTKFLLACGRDQLEIK